MEGKKMEELQKEMEHWKKQAHENQRKTLKASEERRRWEEKYMTITWKQSQENAKLNIKLRVESIQQVEL